MAPLYFDQGRGVAPREALQQLGIGEDGALSLWHEGHSFVKIAGRGRR